MNIFKKLIKFYPYKWLLNFRGYFVYYGQKIFFPKRSIIFSVTLREGIYEANILNLILANCKPNTYYFDLGTNVGTLSIPILATLPNINVASFEASPSTLPFLHKTYSHSDYKDRWIIIPKAVSSEEGEVDFVLSNSVYAAFEGFVNTQRVPMAEKTKVATTTVDAIWSSLGKPNVSVIKCDIEGAEILAFKGAYHCIKTTRPIIIFEWNQYNIKAFGFTAQNLFDFIASINYQLYSIPNFVPIVSPKELEQHAIFNENYVLLP